MRKYMRALAREERLDRQALKLMRGFASNCSKWSPCSRDRYLRYKAGSASYFARKRKIAKSGIFSPLTWKSSR